MIDRPSAQPLAVIPKSLKYRAQDEHLLRRLGAAMVLHWDALSDEMQDVLIDQASLVDDREGAPHERRDIENFIRTAKVVASAKQPTVD